MRRISFPKIILMLIAASGIISLLSFIVMSLWNNILVPVLHVTLITFWQALGLFALAKILFGGFPGRRGWGPGRHGRRMDSMRNKWMNMTPEERANFKKEWRGGCHRGPGQAVAETATAAE
jgi:Ca2+/H+ antiporter, TMEM165/GDT1 family